MSYSISIDGPSGAGKSTISKQVANKLGIEYVNTGEMYRAVALYFLQNGVLNNEDAIDTALNSINLDFLNGHIYLNGNDVSHLIRDEEISSYSSKISRIQKVRDKLVALQKTIASNKSVVMEGRDIGTVVLPEAEYKFFLSATTDERAKRRYNQLLEQGKECDFDTIRMDIEKRDYDDTHRENSPLIVPKNAVEIDSTNYSIDETVDLILDIVRKGNAL